MQKTDRKSRNDVADQVKTVLKYEINPQKIIENRSKIMKEVEKQVKTDIKQEKNL